ncbi:hypothetical protein VNI00_013735 [Paramarasmius palmivorus]|uniref:Cytochrome P450 n=1 Tax=Paramarasmius palmivorus TaxID=297713 RepID=A0AAW0C0E4_9AGAR
MFAFYIIAAPLLGVLLFSLLLLVRSKQRSLKFLRGPPNTSILLGNEYDMLHEPTVGSKILQWMREYGSTFRIKTIFNEDTLIVTDPKALQYILHKSSYHFPKAPDMEFTFTRLFGEGVLSVQGTQHQRQRKILNPAFSTAQIKPFDGIFQSVTNFLVGQWREQLATGNDVIDTTQWFTKLTLDALGRAVFDYEFGALETKDTLLGGMVKNLFVDSVMPSKFQYLWNRLRSYYLPDRIKALGSALYPTKEDIRLKAWNDISKAEAEKLYRNKLQGDSADANDVLGVIARSLDAHDPGRKMDTAEALSQMSTIILAGHDTTGNTLSWLFYELAKHPADQERLYQEIKHVREQKGEELTANDFDSMPFLHAVIKEALRIHPVVARLIREAEQDDVIPLAHPIISASGEMISEVPVAKGQRIWVSIIGYNYLKEVWGEDADEWNPDRHLGVKRPTTLGVYGNLVHELQVITALLVESFQFSMPPGVDIDMYAASAFTSPVVKGKVKEGVQMPVKVKLRE